MHVRDGMKKGGNWIMKDLYDAGIFFLLFAGIYLLMRSLRADENIRKTAGMMIRRMDERDRLNAVRKRELLRAYSGKENLLGRIDRALVYSGIRMRFPGLGAEKFVAGLTALSAFVFCSSAKSAGLPASLLLTAAFVCLVYVFIRCRQMQMLKKTGEDMPKLLDLLGSFAAGGAVCSNIFGQISIYMNEPLRSAFDECAAEGEMSGDISLALLSLADKIEHPQFKQLIRNMEITSRHSEDITGLVNDTRRSLRDHIRESSARKTMLRESAINMLILLVMSFAVILISSSLAETTPSVVLLQTVPGKMTLFVVAMVLLMYFAQAASIYD